MNGTQPRGLWGSTRIMRTRHFWGHWSVFVHRARCGVESHTVPTGDPKKPKCQRCMKSLETARMRNALRREAE